jgi:ubiquitin thioesterase OTU1
MLLAEEHGGIEMKKAPAGPTPHYGTGEAAADAAELAAALSMSMEEAGAAGPVPVGQPVAAGVPLPGLGGALWRRVQPQPGYAIATPFAAVCQHASYSSDPTDSVRVQVVPADNSCLFNSVGYVCDGDRALVAGAKLRQLVADTVLGCQSAEYSEAMLGKTPAAYAAWILKADTWSVHTQALHK